MLRDGIKVLFGNNPFGVGVDWQAHHIIPLQLEDQFGAYLSRIGFGSFDGPVNGVPLPTLGIDAKALGVAQHRGPHDSYTKAVAAALQEIQARHGNDSKAALTTVHSLLDNLKQDLAPTIDLDNHKFHTNDGTYAPRLVLNASDPSYLANAKPGQSIDDYNKIVVSEYLDGVRAPYYSTSIRNLVGETTDTGKASGAVGKAAIALSLASVVKLSKDYLGKNELTSEQVKSLLISSNLEVGIELVEELAKDVAIELVVSTVLRAIGGGIGIVFTAYEVYQNITALEASIRLVEKAWPDSSVLDKIVAGIDKVKNLLGAEVNVGGDGDSVKKITPEYSEKLRDTFEKESGKSLPNEGISLSFLDALESNANKTTLTVHDATASEGTEHNYTLNFYVELSEPAKSDVIFYATTYKNGTNSDYEGFVDKQFKINAGEKGTWIAVNTIPDAAPEKNEQMYLEIHDIQGAIISLSSNGKAYGTIRNDDGPITNPELPNVTSVSNNETPPNGSINYALSVYRANAEIESGDKIPLDDLFPRRYWRDESGAWDISWFSVQDRTAGGGYLTYNGDRVADKTVFTRSEAEFGNWHFVAGDAGRIDEIGFNIIQKNGEYSNSFQAGNGAKVTSVESEKEELEKTEYDSKESALDLDIGEFGSSVSEDGIIEFEIERKGYLNSEIIVEWEVTGTGEHPTSTADFLSTTGLVTLRKGRSDTTFQVRINDDKIFENDEKFKIDLDVVDGNARFSDDDATATILDDDTPSGIDDSIDDHSNFRNQATWVAEEVWARGFIETAGDRDWFRLDLRGGVQYDIKVLEDDDLSLIGGDVDASFPSLSKPAAILWTSSGVGLPLESTSITNRSVLNIEPSEDAIYYLEVGEEGDNDIGQYFVQAEVRVEKDDFQNNISTSGSAVIGEAIEGTFERDNDDDWFAIELDAGQAYRFVTVSDERYEYDRSFNDLQFYAGFSDYAFSMYDQNGILLQNQPSAENFNTTSNIFDYTAEYSGIHYFSIYNDESDYGYTWSAEEVRERPIEGEIVRSGAEHTVDVRFPSQSNPGEQGLDDDFLAVGNKQASAIKFDLTELPDLAKYAAIELFLYETVTEGKSASFSVDIPHSLWEEQSSMSELGNVTLHTLVDEPIAGEWVTIEITDVYNRWKSGDIVNNGILLGTSDLGDRVNYFYSSENTEHVSAKPRLVVKAQEVADTPALTKYIDSNTIVDTSGVVIDILEPTDPSIDKPAPPEKPSNPPIGEPTDQLPVEPSEPHVETPLPDEPDDLSIGEPDEQLPEVPITEPNGKPVEKPKNQPPSDIILSSSMIGENTDGGTAVGTLSAVDDDKTDIATFRIINQAAALFALNGSTLVVAKGARLDYEAATSHDITIEAMDSTGLTFEKVITVAVNDIEESFIGATGDDVLNVDAAINTITTGAGNDTIQGAVADFYSDTITDFSESDEIVFLCTAVDRSDMTVTMGSAIIAVDTDKDGAGNGNFTLEGDFTTGDFMAVTKGTDTVVTFDKFLPALKEGQAIASDLVNGIVNQDFLTGTGTTDFKVTLRDLGHAGYNNVVGVYEVDESGAIVDTRVLFENANTDKSGQATVSDVEDGNRLGFFIVQDAADWAGTLKNDDTLSFVNNAGTAATLADGNDIFLAVNGMAADEFVFHSFSETMNADGIQHALSGVDTGGKSLSVGFEDLTGGGDRDYEDVAFRVELIEDGLLV